jgi:hypothetical protein
MLKRRLAVTGMLVVLALWGASAAHAQTFYSLTVDHCGGCGTSPFGTVELDPAGTGSVLVTVSLSNGNQFVGNGTGTNGLHAFTFDVGGTATIAFSTPGFTADPLQSGGYKQDGFGSFPYAIECGMACDSGPGGSSLIFTVSETGLTVSSFVPNSLAFFFTADILGTTGSGPVAAPTPEPASMLLFGSGLLAIGTVVRRRRLTAA